MMIPKEPGTPGDAKEIKDDVVGILTNGVLLDSHKQTWAYDNCNGHSDKKGQYHYHIPSMCFVNSFEGATFAEKESWWINDDMTEVRTYADMAAQFPAKGTPSPVVGFARDGFPIFALYDENGDLQRGKEMGGSVDECNGKVDSSGKYGYYITADPPFAPPCLKGTIGLFSYASTSIACPADGIENSMFEASAVARCINLEDTSNTATSRAGTTPFMSLKGCDALEEDSGSTKLITFTGPVVMASILLHYVLA